MYVFIITCQTAITSALRSETHVIAYIQSCRQTQSHYAYYHGCCGI